MSGPTPGAVVKRWTTGLVAGTEPMWSLDGRELFYRQGDAMMVVDLAADQGVEGVPRLLFEGSFVADGFGPANYDVAPDGRFVMVQAVRSAAPRAVHVVAHWGEELKRMAPLN